MSRIAISLRRVALVAAFGLPAGYADPAAAQDLRASLVADLAFFDPQTGKSARPEAGTPIGLRVSLTDVTTGRAPRGLTLAGWVRAKAPGNATCEAAAQAFRVTSQPPLGAVDLNGILVVTLNEDASVGVIDPKLNLRSSNMIAAATLDGLPSRMAIDAHRFQALFVTEGRRGVTAMSLLTGETTRHLANGPALSDVAGQAGSGIWIGDMQGQIFALDDPATPRPAGKGPITLREPSEPDSALIAAFGKAGGLVVLDGATGSPILDRPDHEPIKDLALLPDGSVVTLPMTGEVARIHYRDAPERVVDIPLGFDARRIVASPGGRHAIAYAPGGPAAVVIDLARAEVVQPLELTRGVLTEVTFTDDAAYLLSLDGGYAGLIDLDSVGLGRPAQIRKIDLARRLDGPHEGGGLLVPLWPSPQVLAVSPETQTGWLLHDEQAVGEMPPMDSLRLRGGVPRRVAVLDRSFREAEPGVFQTVAAIDGGPHELVLTTGIGGLTACLDFRVRGTSERSGTSLVTLDLDRGSTPIVAGQEVEIAVTFRDRAGKVMNVLQAEFLVPSLTSSWVGRMTARRAPDGTLRGRVRFPHPGPFALQPLGLPDDLHLGSALLVEVAS